MDYASKAYLRPGSHAAKLEKALRILGPKHCLKQPVPRLEKRERMTTLDQWRARRHA